MRIKLWSNKKKLGRKPLITGLTQRKDIVLKTLFRRIKTFFWKDFNKETKYKNYESKTRVLFFEKCMKRYIKNVLQEEITGEFGFVFGGFISPRDMKKLVAINPNSIFVQWSQLSEDWDKIDEIHRILTRFSVKKFSKICKKI